MMKTRKFWPLDYDPEGEIYENLAWDLPGFRREKRFRGHAGEPIGQKPTRKQRAD
jgi:hypothetical protein